MLLSASPSTILFTTVGPDLQPTSDEAMHSVPLDNLRRPPNNSGNATAIPRRDGSTPVGRHDDGPGTLVPLTAKEAAELPELNFKPLALKLWYLVLIQVWFFACLAGVGVLVFLGRTRPAVLHLRMQYSYAVWLYAPAIIGFLTTVLWRGTLQSYNRIIPYTHMAKPLIRQGGKDSRAFLNEPLNSIPGGVVNIGLIISLYQSGDYLSCAVNISTLLTWLLTPVKSGLVQLIKDDVGWGIRISVSFGVIAMITYLWLFLVTLSITIFFSKNQTGLKWSPTTIAAQISLIQDSNILDQFAWISTKKFAPLNDAVRSWTRSGLRLHLGYWKDETRDLVVHGVRFLEVSEDSEDHSLLLSRNPVRPRASIEGVAVDTEAEVDGIMRGNSNTTMNEIRDIQGQANSDLDIERGAHNRDTLARHSNDLTSISRHNTQNDPRPDITRIWNPVLTDAYLIIVTILGASVLAAATYSWAKGFIYGPFNFTPDNLTVHRNEVRDEPESEGIDPEGTVRIFVRGIVFNLLPSLLFGLFNNFFLAADIYQRTMTPIANMASVLDKEDRVRFYPEDEDIKGAMAKDSVLLDYISLDLISCIAAAVGRSNYKIALGLLLATLCNSVYTVIGRIFSFVETPSPGGGIHYVVTIQARNFYAAFAIMVVYIISLWVLRPRGVVRTCRPLYTLMDLATLVHQSHILQCPEFWLRSPSDTEDHLRSQVTLADRVYRYGVYDGCDGNEYVGIAPHNIPRSWEEAAAVAGAGAALPSLYYSVEVARDTLRYGLYGDTALNSARGFLENGPQKTDNCVRVRSNDYRSWRSWIRRRGPRRNARSHGDEASTTSSYEPAVPESQSGEYQRVSVVEPPLATTEVARTGAWERGDGAVRHRSS